VSGVSSGGYMAGQFHVAHSSSVKGAGIVAAGPYNCAQGSLSAAYYNCLTPRLWTPLPSTAILKLQTEALAASGQIDPTSNLAGARVWLFSGTKDRIVLPEVVEALRAYYKQFNATAVLVADKPAGHAMITENAGNECATSKTPYINDCDYDAAGELLRHLLGALQAPAAKESGRLLRFAQKEFGDGSIGLGDEGFAYIPAACDKGGCRVHVAFHGCRQHAGAIQDRFAREAGYNRWADTNRLVVLYPQAAPSYFAPFNPLGCWDWWGYSGARYATKEGAQVKAVKAMLDRLLVK
jgi:poly(3-hydroxybutyrate) depolymerase